MKFPSQSYPSAANSQEPSSTVAVSLQLHASAEVQPKQEVSSSQESHALGQKQDPSSRVAVSSQLHAATKPNSASPPSVHPTTSVASTQATVQVGKYELPESQLTEPSVSNDTVITLSEDITNTSSNVPDNGPTKTLPAPSNTEM